MDTRLIVFSCMLVSAVSAASISNCPSHVPRDQYLRAFGSNCYSFVLYQQRSFQAAEIECAVRNGHLAIVRDPSIQDFIYRTLKHRFNFNKKVWIGLSDTKTRSNLLWSDGSHPIYTHWASGQPGVLSGLDDCVAMDVSDGGNWYDISCDDVLFLDVEYPFVCEYSMMSHAPHTVPTTTVMTTTPSTVTTTERTTPSTTPTPTTTTPTPTTPSTTPTPFTTTPTPTTPSTTPTPTTPSTTPTTTTTTPTPTTPSTTPTPTTVRSTTQRKAGGCPPFQCSLDCGLAGYKIDRHNCVLCECDD